MAYARSLARVRLVLPREVRELAGVLLTVALHLTWTVTDWPRALLVVPLVAVWLANVAITARREPEALDGWGLRWKGLGPASAAIAIGAVPAAFAMIAVGLATGAPFPVGFWVALAVYPVWGLVQQLLLQGMVAGPLARRAGVPLATMACAALFSAVHWPDAPVMAATLLLGVLFVPVFARWRNLWPLALAHGWLGTLLYYGVLHRDPLSDYVLTP